MNRGELRQLPTAFVGAAFVNFVVGAVLGGWMASSPSTWVEVGPIHGELNPYGWLTMMIYGMTYAVLALSAGIRPPYRWLVWLHWAVTEAGVALIIAADVVHLQWLFALGWLLQAIAPVLFLVNILSAVITARRSRAEKGQTSQPPATDRMSFLWRNAKYQQTDPIAQRGTDVALMLYIVGVVWAVVSILLGQTTVLDLGPRVSQLLTYYGWIAGTVLAVSLHLFPRLTQVTSMQRATVEAGQALWGVGLILSLMEGLAPWLASLGVCLLGLSIVWYAVLYLWGLTKGRSGDQTQVPMTAPSRAAWTISFLFAGLLGVVLLLGANPLSLYVMHLLFLGWITTLVYSIGYTLFPLILNRTAARPGYAYGQLTTATVGAALLAFSFSPMPVWFAIPVPLVDVLLACGGILAALGALAFIVQWPFAKRSS